jgi:cysteine desulfurase
MIYLDHNATSPMLPEVREAMAPWWGVPANPSSAHRTGQTAAVAVEAARVHVARLVDRSPEGVVFTSGATEANHLGLRGCLEGATGDLVISRVEHPCVRAAATLLAARGVNTRWWDVDKRGVVRVEPLGPGTRAVALMAVNHETGVRQPLAEAVAAAKAVGAWVHVDATQGAGRGAMALDGVDAVVLSSHKLGGAPGVGALVLQDGEPFPALFPGSQERGRRGGTVPTALVVGFGEACRIAWAQQEARIVRWRSLRESLERALVGAGGRIIGADVPRVGNTSCVVFDGLVGETLVQAFDLRGICVSAGAACTSGSLEPSATLLAMGDPHPMGALRISLGPDTGEEEIDAFCTALPAVVEALRLAASWV